MAVPGLNGPGPTPVACALLDDWLDRLGRALPAPARRRHRIVEEMRDGLHCAAEHHRGRGASPLAAARLAIAELGDPRVVAAAFADELRAARARRTGVLLIGTGPLVGLAWIAALAAPGLPPRPSVVLAADPLLPYVLGVAIPAAVFAVAATGRLGRWLPAGSEGLARSASTLAAATCAAGDATLLATLVHLALSAPASLTWPAAAVAATASTVRLALAAHASR